MAALRVGYRGVAVDLKPYAKPYVVQQVLEIYRIEGRRMAAAAAAIKVVGRALRRQARHGTAANS
ncbi:hypothetical protein AB0K16_51210 [Nonomuraea jabiensis]|uniref:hypothetical protein n=1 Tax=Nonomuraea jabiensis TaxID=882448 RepID=UPI0034418879